jgi:hypothetical protein
LPSPIFVIDAIQPAGPEPVKKSLLIYLRDAPAQPDGRDAVILRVLYERIYYRSIALASFRRFIDRYELDDLRLHAFRKRLLDNIPD